MDDINRLSKIIANSKNILFFGGAGVSTESGIPDFRSINGLYNQKWNYNPETILSHTFLKYKTEEFYRFYCTKMNCMNAKPNQVHFKLVEMEKIGKLTAIITQNIDGLHQAAGSKNVYELHGSVHRNYCIKCHKFYNGTYIFSRVWVPMCKCGGLIRPDVILYEESLDENIVESTINAISRCDTLIIGGTSLNVYPAAGFIRYFNGDNLVIINKSYTQYNKNANFFICSNISEVFSKLKF